MPAALKADWSGIRAANVSGVTLEQLSQQTGISLGTLKARSMREGWTTQAKAIRLSMQPTHATNMQPLQPSVVVDATSGKVIPNTEKILKNEIQPYATTGFEAAQNSIAIERQATKAAASRASRRVFESLDKLDPASILQEAGKLRDMATVAEKSQDWQSGQQTVQVNIFDDGVKQADAIEI